MAGDNKIRTIEAIIDPDGSVRLSEKIQLDGPRRALVTILAEVPADSLEVTYLSQAALAEDWNRPEEDEAWAKLQSEQ